MNTDFEIDVRRTIRLLLRSWLILGGVALLFGLLGFALSTLTPNAYQATALVAVTQQRYIVSFDARFQTVNNLQPAYKAFQDLATSDEVLGPVYEQYRQDEEKPLPVDEFATGVATLTPGADPSILRLSIKLKDPQKAADLANLWAKLFTRKANEVYSGQSQAQLTFYQDQLNLVQADLKTANERMVEFQTRNQEDILQNRLDAMLQRQNEALAMQQRITDWQQNITGLREMISKREAASAADQINLLLIQLQAFTSAPVVQAGTDTSPDAKSGPSRTVTRIDLPFQIQLSDIAGQLEQATPESQLAVLDSLSTALDAKAAELKTSLSDLLPEVMDTQGRLEAARAERADLERQQSLTQEAYSTLTRKVQESRITTQADNASGEAQLASTADVPKEPVSKNRLRNTAIGLVLGGLVSLFIVIVSDWWRSSAAKETARPAPDR